MGVMDFIRNPLSYHPDYMGEGNAQDRYAKQRADLVTGLPSMAPSAQTQNAVTVATNTGGSSGRTSSEGNSPPASKAMDAPQSVPVPTSGSQAWRAPNANVPYPGGFEGSGASDTSRSDFMRSIPTFASAPAMVAQGAQQMGGAGVLPPEFHSQIASMLDEARPLLSSAGIVDRMRGRQMMRARDRMIQGATSISGARIAGINAETGQANAQAGMLGAQTGAFRASNEVPLALLDSATRRYGVDVGANTARMQDDTHRYTNDQSTAAIREGTQARLFADLPTIQRSQMVNDKLVGGDYEGAHEIAGVGLRDTRQPNPSVSWNPMGGGGVVADAAGVRPFDFAALTARAAAEAKAAQDKKDREAVAGKAK